MNKVIFSDHHGFVELIQMENGGILVKGLDEDGGDDIIVIDNPIQLDTVNENNIDSIIIDYITTD